MNIEQLFTDYYRNNTFQGTESRSGQGSTVIQTEEVRRQLPLFIKAAGVKSVLDIPCGDFNWMKTLELEIESIGADIVLDLVKLDQDRYGSDHRKFIELNLLHDPLPKVDVIFCRDCLVHFSNSDVIAAVKNIKASGAEYLLTTTFPKRLRNQNIVTGEWRPINLSESPFRLPVPLEFVFLQHSQ